MLLARLFRKSSIQGKSAAGRNAAIARSGPGGAHFGLGYFCAVNSAAVAVEQLDLMTDFFERVRASRKACFVPALCAASRTVIAKRDQTF